MTKNYISEIKFGIIIITVGQEPWSVLGREALNYAASEPTMTLGLQHGMEDYNQHVVVHEFGHALGLLHEHQRSGFLLTAKKYLDENKMKQELKISDKKFRQDWWDPVQQLVHESRSYDDESVMHYW